MQPRPAWARLDQLGDVLLGIFDKGQDGHHRDAGVDAGIGQGVHGSEAGGGGRRAGFDLSGKVIIGGRDRKADGGVNLVDLFEQVEIAQDQVGLGDDMDGEAVLGDHFQGAAGRVDTCVRPAYRGRSSSQSQWCRAHACGAGHRPASRWR